MRRIANIGLLATATTLAALTSAGAGDMSGIYGNTIVCTYPDAGVSKITLDASGNYTVVTPGPTLKGTWHDDGSTVCYNQTDPVPGAGEKPVCNSSALKKIGDTWSVTDPTGKTCSAVLVAGKP